MDSHHHELYSLEHGLTSKRWSDPTSLGHKKGSLDGVGDCHVERASSNYPNTPCMDMYYGTSILRNGTSLVASLQEQGRKTASFPKNSVLGCDQAEMGKNKNSAFNF